MVHWTRAALILGSATIAAAANGFLFFFDAGFHV